MKTFWRDWAGHLLAGFALAIWFLPGLELFSTRYGLGVMLAGTSERPFAYRVLTPILVRAAEVFYGSPIPAFLFVLAGACVLLSVALWELADHRPLAWCIALLGVMAITWNYRHLFDPLTWVLWALTLVCMRRQQWAAMGLAFALACLSKETAILLVPIFVANYFDKLPRKQWLALSAGMTMIWAAIHLEVMWMFRANSGGDLELHAAEQVAYYPIYAVILLVGLALLVWSWKRQPEFLRRSLVVFPVFLVFFLAFCSPLEWRDFGELEPVLAILLDNALSWRTYGTANAFRTPYKYHSSSYKEGGKSFD